MSKQHPLLGSCSCGRYKYVVLVPENDVDQAQIHFATDSEHRRNQAALLTGFLRVPLSWYQSQTVAFFPDETHNSISRTFTPLHEPHCQRKFCGYCGTHLSYWTEQPHDEQDFLHVTLGSLRSRDLSTLEDLELLPEDIQPGITENEAPGQEAKNNVVSRSQADGITRTTRTGNDGPMTWFEESLDGSRLGRTRKTRRGMGTSADGSTTVEWEVTEYGDEEMEDAEAPSSTSTRSKRKLDDVGTDNFRAGTS